MKVSKEERQCWCFCQSGPVSCSLRLDRTGFVPGEDISLDVDIDNATHKNVTSSYVAMKQVKRFCVRLYRSPANPVDTIY